MADKSSLPFANDGSFMAQFMAQQGGAASESTAAGDSSASAAPAEATTAPAADASQSSSGAATAATGYGYPGYGGANMYAAYGGYPAAAAYGAYSSYGSYGYPPAAGYGAAGGSSYGSGAYGGGYGGSSYGGGGGGGSHPHSDKQPSRSVWVGNLHPATSEDDLRREFQAFGYIESVKMLLEKNCAFVNFSNLDDSTKAYNGAWGMVILGNEVKIGWGRADTGPSTSQMASRHDAEGDPSTNLWVGNLAMGTTEDQLYQLFRSFGDIDHIKVLTHKNCAFVNFGTLEQAQRARRELNGRLLGGRNIKIGYGKGGRRSSDSNPPGGGGSYGGGSSAYGSAPREEPRDDPPPRPTPPPADADRKNVIDKMADFVNRNGPGFEAMMRDKERDNPKLQFLFGGPEYDYYRWKLHCLQNPGVEAGGGSSGSAGLSMSEQRDLERILRTLDDTKDTIMAGKDWVVKHIAQAADIVRILRSHVDGIAEFSAKLHVLYMINDVLHYVLQTRSRVDALDTLSEAWKLPLVFILRASYQGQGSTQQQQVLQLLKLWGDRSIYGTTTVKAIENAVKSTTPPPEPPNTLSAPPSAPTGDMSFAPVYAGHGGGGSRGGPVRTQQERADEYYKRRHAGQDDRGGDKRPRSSGGSGWG